MKHSSRTSHRPARPTRARPLVAAALCVVACAWPASARVAAQTSAASGGARQEWEALQKRLSEPRSYNLLVSGTWTLIHGSTSEAEVKEILNLIVKLSEPFDRQQVGGAAGFKDSAASFLESKDDVVSGFAATVLAAAGDGRYARRIAALLWKKEPPGDARSSRVTSRGRAAVALGLLGAREYTPKLASMLRSPNSFDRSGAAWALGSLGARQHAKAVAALLTDERFKYESGDAYIGALFEMGVAAEYAGVFAAVMRDELVSPETAEAAAYALAALKARRYAGDVARLLGDKYRRGHAAKALAVMGAKQYAPDIARMLRDEGSLDQAAALLALGILGAKEYAPEAARILKEQRESFGSHYAAEALVLMGAEEYAADVVPLLERAFGGKHYLGTEDFHPLVEAELVRVRRRYEESFLKMRARRAK